MFKIEELLTLGKIVLPDSLVIEKCEDYFEDLKDYYVCLPQESINPLKDYINSIANSDFILKTYENNPVNGLHLLRSLEHIGSYTSEFVKYYGSVEGIHASFAAANDSQEENLAKMNLFGDTLEEVTVGSVETAQEPNVPDNTESSDVGGNLEHPTDFVDDSIFTEFIPEEPQTDSETVEPNTIAEETNNDNLNNVTFENSDETMTELLLMIRGVAQKLGVIDYDDSKILSRSDMRMVQRYISGFSPITVMEAFKGALSLVETQEDRIAATRFIELFTTYIRENDLKR